MTEQRERVVPSRALSGFYLYDFANSAFVTVVVTAVGGPFVVAIADEAAHNGKVALLGLHVTPGAVFGYAVSLSVVLQVLVLPLLGSYADRPGAKRGLLARGTAVGVLATLGLAMAPFGHPGVAAALFVAANAAFGAAVLAYDSLLGDVAAPAERDRVSAKAYAFGYVGGGLVLAVDLALLQAHGSLGLSKATAVRIAIAGAAVWWGAFGVMAHRRLAALSPMTPVGREANDGLKASLQGLRELPGTARFLLAFLLFNDAVQAVIALSAVVLTQELFVGKGRPADDATAFLLQLVLLIQVVAVLGAMLSARIAGRIGAKRTILAELVIWSGVVVYAFLWLDTIGKAYFMGVVIALVLGGTQCLARSSFSRLVPAGRQAAFFGFYELADRGTAWVGTLIFSIVLDVTGSYRDALLSLLVLFVSGGLLLAATDLDAAEVAAARWEAA